MSGTNAHGPRLCGPVKYPGGKNGMFYADCIDDGCDYQSGFGTEASVMKDAQQHADAKNVVDHSRQVQPDSLDIWYSETCPMPGCKAELYLELSGNVPIMGVTVPEDLRWTGNITCSWQVVCTEGHTILLPLDSHLETAHFTDDCASCKESGVEHDDMARLREVIRLGQST